MIRMGRIYDNWMIGVALTNRKLQSRGLRILSEASGATVAEATRALRQAGHNMSIALIMLRAGVNAREAQRMLRDAGDNVRDALARKVQIPKGQEKRHG
jgi:N-acetylmuramic acid 6-phosphate etherase